MSEELKPCPICGGSYLSICDHGGMVHHEYRIECNYCGCSCQTGVRTKEEAIAAWNALPRRLRWTKEKPTTCDFYWYRSEGGSIEIGIVYADVIGNLCIHFAGEEEPHLLELVDGEWAGPLLEPEE